MNIRYAVRDSAFGWVFGEDEEDAMNAVEGDVIGSPMKLPTEKQVCPRCHGEGVHDNPAFSNGISQEEFDDDPDFAEDYRAGVYDVGCDTCEGQRVIDVIDESRLPPDLVTSLHRYYEEEAAFRREQEAERRMGA